METNGTAALVTGGASGLGEATARRLAAGGALVTIFDRDRAKAEAVAADIGAGTRAVGGDVTSETDTLRAIAAATADAPLGSVV
jgi:Short-chain alcohol dehydrogenase of unknown specificity